jgi:hypothetical protein
MTRISAVAAPVLLFAYGILHWIDGQEGDEKGGLAWNVGHTAFFISIGLFAVLAVDLRRVVRTVSPDRRLAAAVGTTATLVGAACFLWVILGDLFAGLRDAARLPDPLTVAGPLLFQLGMLTLLLLLVIARPRRLSAWSPVLVLLGFAAIAANLDLLPLAATLIGAGLLPLAARPWRDFDGARSPGEDGRSRRRYGPDVNHSGGSRRRR